jgi:GntR family transcriptional regulator
MMVDRSNPYPLYHQLKQILLGKIQQGEFSAGEAIPTESALQEQYGVSRITVRRALSELTSDGYLIRQPGKGTYVTHRKLKDKSRQLGGFAADLQARNMLVASKILQFSELPAPRHVAQQMGLEPGTPLLMYQRLIIADGAPIALSNCFVDLPPEFEVTVEELERESIFPLLERKYGYTLRKAERIVEAIMLMPEAALPLEGNPFSPALMNTLVVLDDNNRSVLFAQTTYRGDRYKHVCPMIE